MAYLCVSFWVVLSYIISLEEVDLLIISFPFFLCFDFAELFDLRCSEDAH